MAHSHDPRRDDFSLRLRIVVLGGAACTVGDCGGHAGDDPGVHGAPGDYFSTDTEADVAACGCIAYRHRWRGGADEPIAESGRSADRNEGGAGAAHCGGYVVDRVGVA